jgi:hypothetical protein
MTDEQSDAIVEAMLRALKRGGYRAIVRQIAECRARLQGLHPDDPGRKALAAVIDKLEATKATMKPPEGYLPGVEG